MRLAILVAVVVGCGSDAIDGPRTLTFGPYSLAPGQEIVDQCVSATLHNDAPIYVNSVAFDSGPGFHHSNWFFVPEDRFPGADGTWPCADRNYDQIAAAAFGGVLFGQSTQSPHEVQQFPPGAAIVIPRHSKIVAGTHLLNGGDTALTVPLALTITPIPVGDVTIRLAAMSFEDAALGIPPHRASRFSVTECDLAGAHQRILGRPPDFSIYYGLAHYHALGTGLTIEAVRDDGTASTIFATTQQIGSPLGGAIDPPFAIAGYTKLRFSCTFDNPGDATIVWGFGAQEMCVFLGYTDSTYSWAGGAVTEELPGPGVDTGSIIDFTHACDVYGVDATHPS